MVSISNKSNNIDSDWLYHRNYYASHPSPIAQHMTVHLLKASLYFRNK
ncbi:hypothetical protein TPENAI_61089 [Tenacibaculum litopenaei]